ncbi:hypothetical protein RJ641_025702 [Dillenia turbinata]|uniref:Hexosyltransferase n=1 Tax=Dillenia turbinata TaxID=194707 RepID=A0AAN8W245_9MAGN
MALASTSSSARQRRIGSRNSEEETLPWNPNSNHRRDIAPNLSPNPSPRPLTRIAAFFVLIILGLLQFLPATHFRHPSDPSRTWQSFSSLSPGSPGDGNSSLTTATGTDDGMLHIVTWMDSHDLWFLAVLANSTLSNSRFPDLVYFHFYIPDGLDTKVSYFKLKVLFPYTNIEILGQQEVKEKIEADSFGEDFIGVPLEDIVPFVIPSLHRSLNRFMYVRPNVVMKGSVEELLSVDLRNYAVAVTDDCTRHLDTFVNPDVLNAIQRSASKPWVSMTPYAKNACLPDLTVIVIDAVNLEKDMVQSILWWSRVLNLSERMSMTNPAVALALYNRYLKLSTTWLAADLMSSETTKSKIFHYNHAKSISSMSFDATSDSDKDLLWEKYLPPLANQILATSDGTNFFNIKSTRDKLQKLKPHLLNL